jgi:hypothetical protein
MWILNTEKTNSNEKISFRKKGKRQMLKVKSPKTLMISIQEAGINMQF